MNCPICNTEDVNEYNTATGNRRFDCARCGEFEISGSALAELPEKLNAGVHRRALLSYEMRRTSERKPRPLITSYNLESFWQADRLPSPREQSDQLILLIGDKQLSPEAPIRLAFQFVSAWIGASLLETYFDALNWHIRYLTKSGLLEPVDTDHNPHNPVGQFQLTMAGWDRYFELKKVQTDSKIAFMAMKFGDAELDNVVSTVFTPAVSRTGFNLRKLTDQQGAGIIDNQLRAAILQSRFIVADLTHSNNGAYWEAGYADGLGLPVIYSCKKSVWDNESTHFDTNHMLTILWDTANLAAAAEELTATIRATLRHEAKQED